MNDRVNEKEARVKHKIGRGVKLTIVTLIAVAFVVFFVLVLPALADGSECVAPQGYQLVESRMAFDLLGNPVFVVRGVFATGEGSTGGKKVVIPACGSKDQSIEEVNNVYLFLDGQQIFLLTGSVGRDLSSNPTEVPQP